MSQVCSQIQVEDSLLKEATQICKNLGIDIETAINLFLEQTVLDNALPCKTNRLKNPIKPKKVIEPLLNCKMQPKKTVQRT